MATAQEIDSRLLRALRAAPPEAGLPAAALAARLGLDEPALAARVDGLRAVGYRIDTAAGSCRLVAAPAHLVADDLCAALPEPLAGIGRQIVVFAETDSTNDLAARAGHDGLPGGLVIFAEAQRAGRGRLGRRWTAPLHRALLFSVLLRPDTVPGERWPELTFCAALAVAETAEALTGRPARIKWPNDVLVEGRKVAGILLERHEGRPAGFVVAGIGLNVLQREEDFPPELRGRAGSLAMFTPPGRVLERREAAAAVLTRLEGIVARWPTGFADIAAACARRGCAQPPEAVLPAALPAVLS